MPIFAACKHLDSYPKGEFPDDKEPKPKPRKNRNFIQIFCHRINFISIFARYYGAYYARN